MVIIGAKGLAKELLAVLSKNNQAEDLCFFDNISDDIPDLLYGCFPVLKSWDSRKEHFRNSSPEFALGTGGPNIRKRLAEKAQSLGGQLCSVISNQIFLGEFGNTIGDGVCILPCVNLTCDILIGEGSLINKSATISHDVKIGRYCDIAPVASLLGRSSIGDLTSIGAHAVVLPGVTVGSNCVIGAGAVVIRDVPDGRTFAGVPAKLIEKSVSL